MMILCSHILSTLALIALMVALLWSLSINSVWLAVPGLPTYRKPSAYVGSELPCFQDVGYVWHHASVAPCNGAV